MRPKALPAIIFGVLLISCGGLWLIGNLFNVDIDFGLIWPVFLLFPGIMFYVAYVTSKDKKRWSALIPATILTLLGITFFINTFVNHYFHYGQIWAWTVFMYPASVAIAFAVGWLASGRKNALILPAIVLGLISLMTFCCISFSLIVGDGLFSGESGRIVWPMLFIFVGLCIIATPILATAFGLKSKNMENWGKGFGKQMEKMGDDIGKAVEESVHGVEEAEVVETSKKENDAEQI